jgi:hypothetical protein
VGALRDRPAAQQNELLALYAGEDTAQLPQGPRILAEKIKAKLQAEKKAAAPSQTAPAASQP